MKSLSESSQKASTDTVSKAAFIYDKLLQDRNKLYCLFLQHTFPLFTSINLELQEEAPKIHVMLDTLQELLHQLQLRFVEPGRLLQATMPDKCDYKRPENQREDGDLIMGTKLREFLSSGQLRDEKVWRVIFLQWGSTLWHTMTILSKSSPCRMMFSNMPEWLTQQNEWTRHSVAYFVNIFQLADMTDQDALEIEFASYQVGSLDGVILDDKSWLSVDSDILSEEQNNWQPEISQLVKGNANHSVTGTLQCYRRMNILSGQGKCQSLHPVCLHRHSLTSSSEGLVSGHGRTLPPNGVYWPASWEI